MGPLFVSNKLHKHCVLTWHVREGGEGAALSAIAQISCKSVLWSVPPPQPSLLHPIDGRMDCNDRPQPHAQNYAPRADTQLMRSAEKSQAFSLSALWRCKSWHMIVMTDRGRSTGDEACQEAGFNCDQDIVYSEVYEGLKWGRVSQVEEFVPSISWWHLFWPNWLHISSCHRWKLNVSERFWLWIKWIIALKAFWKMLMGNVAVITIFVVLTWHITA